MSLGKIRGTHQFLGWLACNRCGRKWNRLDVPAAEIRAHLADCQPDLATHPVRVRLLLVDGTHREVDAYPTPIPGLVIHPGPDHPGTYTITQQHTGVGLITRLADPEAALGLACDIGPMADWTQPVSEAVARQCLPIARRWGWERDWAPNLPLDVYRAAGAIL